MRRKLVTLAVLGLFAACGFPGVNYENGSDGGGNDASPSGDTSVSAEASGDDDSADGTTGDGASSSGGDASDSASGDGEASTGTDAAGDGSDSSSSDSGDSSADAPGDAVEESPGESGADAPVDAPADAHDAGVDALVCDSDGDGYKVEGVAACGTGNDCCDTDKLAHPGQMSWFTTADQCGSLDYNCNGTIDPEFASNIKCGGTGLLGCTGGSAFVGPDPGCGNTGLYATCVGNGALACQPGNEVNTTQECH
ncbi:MAG TPA: hypothetical protein VGL81_24620 [Polyangiaceae bacterium]